MENKVFSLSQEVEQRTPIFTPSPLTTPTSVKGYNRNFENLILELNIEDGFVNQHSMNYANSVTTNQPCSEIKIDGIKEEKEDCNDINKMCDIKDISSSCSGSKSAITPDHKTVVNNDSMEFDNESAQQKGQIGAGRQKIKAGQLRLHIPQSPSSPLPTPTQVNTVNDREIMMSRKVVGIGGGVGCVGGGETHTNSGHLFFPSVGANSDHTPTQITGQPTHECVIGKCGGQSACKEAATTKHRPVYETQESIHDPRTALMYNDHHNRQHNQSANLHEDKCQCKINRDGTIAKTVTGNSLFDNDNLNTNESNNSHAKVNKSFGFPGPIMNHENSQSTLVDMDYNNAVDERPITIDFKDGSCRNFPSGNTNSGIRNNCKCSTCSHHYQQQHCHRHQDNDSSCVTIPPYLPAAKKSGNKSFRKCLKYGSILVSFIIISMLASLLTVYLLGYRGGVKLGQFSSDNHAGETGMLTSGFCVPCKGLQLTSDEADDKTLGLEREGDDCCAHNAEQMQQIIQAIAEKQVRVNNIRQPIIQSYQSGNVSMMDLHEDRNMYAAHVYLGLEDDSKLQDTMPSEESEEGDYENEEGEEEGPFIDDKYVVLKSWTKDTETAVVRKEINFDPAKGRFQIRKDGLYKVYSHLGVKAPIGGSGTGLVFSQRILKDNISFGGQVTVLEDTQLAPCPDINTNHACHSSTLDSLLNLRKGDEIFVASTHTELVMRDLKSSFFGLYRIE